MRLTSHCSESLLWGQLTMGTMKQWKWCLLLLLGDLPIVLRTFPERGCDLPIVQRRFQKEADPQTVPIVVKTFQTLFPSCTKQFPLSGNSKEFPLFSERFQKEADFPLFWVIVMGSADLGNDETMEMVSALVAREPPHCSPDVSRERL